MARRIPSARLRRSVLLSVALVASTLALLPAPTADALDSGVTFGAYAQPTAGQDNIEAIQELEAELGVKLPLIRGFSNWDDQIGADKPLHTWARDGDRQVMVSVKPKRENGERVLWRDIANAEPGSLLYADMAELADSARRFGEPMIVSFHHEPEAGPNIPYGDSDDFKAAFRRFVSVFRAEGADNVSFAWTMTSWSFEVGDFNANDRRRAELWYPGSDVVDFLASDPYNWNNCRGSDEPWTPLETTIEPFMDFAERYPDKPLILAEWGSDEGTPGQKAAWLDDTRSMFKSGKHKDRLAAVIYFHDDGLEEGWPDCDWWLDSSPDALTAARRIASDSFFRAPVQLPPSNATVLCGGQVATLVGTAGADVLDGTEGVDVIAGLGGYDIIRGFGGNDIICGGDGRDTIRGGDGADTIYGGELRDRLFGDDGNDRIFGGTADDRILGGAGRDYIEGNGGDDQIRGGSRADTLVGNGGDDRVIGSNGSDILRGGKGNDILDGSAGTDSCDGGTGSTTFLSCE